MLLASEASPSAACLAASCCIGTASCGAASGGARLACPLGLAESTSGEPLPLPAVRLRLCDTDKLRVPAAALVVAGSRMVTLPPTDEAAAVDIAIGASSLDVPAWLPARAGSVAVTAWSRAAPRGSSAARPWSPRRSADQPAAEVALLPPCDVPDICDSAGAPADALSANTSSGVTAAKGCAPEVAAELLSMEEGTERGVRQRLRRVSTERERERAGRGAVKVRRGASGGCASRGV